MTRPRKSNLKRGKSDNKLRKSVEFANPIENVSQIEPRKSTSSKKKRDRRLVDEEDEPFVKEIKEFLSMPEIFIISNSDIKTSRDPKATLMSCATDEIIKAWLFQTNS